MSSYLIIVVLMILGALFVVMSYTESRVAERNRLAMQAFYIAEAGIERGLYDLRQDFVLDSSPSWADGDINGIDVTAEGGPDTVNYYELPYPSTSLNGGSYLVELKNVGADSIWVKSTGTLGDVTQTILVYGKMQNLSPWNNAIFAGAGASGAAVNGNVEIRGSVHILGSDLDPTDYAVDLGGTAELVGNNYNGLDAALLPKVPVLPTTIYNGENVSTLNAELRVKVGKVGLSGSATVGEVDVPANSTKETVDNVFVTNGWGGTGGTGNVHSDNGWSNSYDLGDSVSFPSLSDPYGAGTYQEYLESNALVISADADLDTLANIDPNSNFSFSGPKGSISMDGNGNLTISGIVYINDPDGTTTTKGDLNMDKDGSDKTITYTGTGSILSEGDANINVNLITSGDNSFPNNILGIMTPQKINFDEANINVMGLFYAEDEIKSQKQTDVMGTFVSNYFNMGTNVPKIYQVPDVIYHLPPGLIGQEGAWVMKIVSWEKL